MKLLAFFFSIYSLILSAETPQEVLDELLLGNQRFMSGETRFYNNIVKLKKISEKQEPFCTVITCSDSRVSPEILFDQPLGRLFVVRIAGNVITPEVVESVSFAVNHLKVPLIFVLGHDHCGLIAAAKQKKYPSQLPNLERLAAPFIKKNMSLVEAIKSNAKGQAKALQELLLSQQKTELKRDQIVSGFFDFPGGEVKILTD